MSGELPVMPLSDLLDGESVTVRHADNSVALVGARCLTCGTSWFPTKVVCPACAAPDPQRYLVGPQGTLYSYSTVHVSSARPTPYVLGYVDLDEGVRVLATIEGGPGGLRLDARCHLEVSEDGRWWFMTEEP